MAITACRTKRGEWTAYDGETPLLSRKTKWLALRDANYDQDPIRCCGRKLFSWDDQVRFDADGNIEVNCRCCGTKSTRSAGEETKRRMVREANDLIAIAV